MYCEYKIEIMLRNIVMTVLLLQTYQLIELQLDQMIGKAVKCVQMQLYKLTFVYMYII